MTRFIQSIGRRSLIGGRNTWPVVLALAFVLSNLFTFGVARLALPGTTAETTQAAPRPDGGGPAAAGPTVVPRKIQVQWSKTLPTPSAQERQAEQAALKAERQLKPAPVGPVYHLTTADTAALARTAGPPLPTPRTASRTTPGAPHANSDFDIEQVAMVSSGGICPTDCNLIYVSSGLVRQRAAPAGPGPARVSGAGGNRR